MKNIEFNEETIEGGKFENIEYKNELLEDTHFINTSFEKSDFLGTEFNNVEFDEIDAKEVNFEKCKMQSDQLNFNGNFENCNWQEAEFDRIERIADSTFLNNDFQMSKFLYVIFSYCNLQNNNFSQSFLDASGFWGGTLNNNIFIKARLTGSFTSLVDEKGDFTEAVLDCTNWDECICTKDIFKEANMICAYIVDTRFISCDFDKAKLTKCKFRESELTDCSFKDAELADTTFIECTLKNIDFTSVKYENVTFEDCKFENVTFTEQQKKDFGVE